MKHWKWAVLGAAVILVGILRMDRAMPANGWGLSFQTPGAAPAAPVSQEKLSELDGAYLDPDGGKVLYLTFDAGYENGFTAEILDILKSREVPAAFFLVGDYLERNPDLVRRMVAEGHIVGNHTMDHPDMSKADVATFTAQITQMEELYQEVTGQTLPKFYRPPQGLYSEENLKMAQKLGYKTVFWSLAYADWNDEVAPSDAKAMQILKDNTHPGAIVLLHPTSAINVRILGEMIRYWKGEGYTFHTLDEIQ